MMITLLQDRKTKPKVHHEDAMHCPMVMIINGNPIIKVFFYWKDLACYGLRSSHFLKINVELYLEIDIKNIENNLKYI